MTKLFLPKILQDQTFSLDGKMEGEIRSSAGLDGTTIIAENLFLESESRRKALKNPAEEMSRIADVVIRYAIKNP